MSDAVILIIIGTIYILGCVIYCILSHNQIGTTDYSIEWWGAAEYTIDATYIVMQSFFWPFMFVLLLILSPILIGTNLLNWYHYKYKNKCQIKDVEIVDGLGTLLKLLEEYLVDVKQVFGEEKKCLEKPGLVNYGKKDYDYH